ncbi:uncharacterized protein Z519_04670 [Cladophialophora bantiana CBS 173.52]|uniref:AB hydrolase-1 domain-containing protein n=1 Tax=Cladophialophora bantiana (strain ATCC 10958 / CBS 173.52 / CDC B-1940 / NIH 8579) TaxID=1442370 RepID=A0A0D2HMU0_CLAB1|nr:uncharacterized protein Z519_04670 [Cladophialophora bantiana CBS 173.52]KIW94693.1 hypothetical protein Z519_04670 [Cladophialophora bantiana CBS 173.52]
MDNDTSDSLLLPDGRKLGYTQYGSLTGRAVFFIHGHPGSRFEGAHLHNLGLKLGARIITPERPGMGLSSPQPGRTLLNCPKDVEHLANHLKLESYGVLGVSGGGPYALACAYALPRDKLKCVSIVCGLGPVYEIGMKGARWVNWIGFAFGYRYTPPFINRWFWQSQTCGRLDLSDEERLERHMKEFSKPKTVADQKDFESMTNEVNARRFLRSSRGAFAQGYDGALQDGRVLCTDFGFRIEDIRSDLPVQLWYGKLDVNVPLNHGETIAKRLGDRAVLRVEDETHASIFFNWREQFLGDLVKNI